MDGRTDVSIQIADHSFYRGMHYSAKRGIEITCCASVCLSVTLVDQDHIGWKSWKLIARTISPTEVGWEKVAGWSTKAALFLKRVKAEEKLPWRAYRNSPKLFQTVPTPTPYGLLFPKIGGLQPPKL